jgi:hypothetical protein
VADIYLLFPPCFPSAEETCTEPAQLQCFSAFDAATTTTSTGSGSDADAAQDTADCNDAHHSLLSQTWFVATMLGCVAAVSLTVGALLGGYFLTQRGEEARRRGKLSAGINSADIDQSFLLGEMSHKASVY